MPSEFLFSRDHGPPMDTFCIPSPCRQTKRINMRTYALLYLFAWTVQRHARDVIDCPLPASHASNLMLKQARNVLCSFCLGKFRIEGQGIVYPLCSLHGSQNLSTCCYFDSLALMWNVVVAWCSVCIIMFSILQVRMQLLLMR